MKGTPFRKLPDYVQGQYREDRRIGQAATRASRRKLLAEERAKREADPLRMLAYKALRRR